MKLKENVLYEIYTQDEENFDVGYYWAQDERYLLFSSINLDGLDDGLLIINKDSVNHVEYETQYCDKMLKLTEYHKVGKRKNSFQQNKLIQQLLKYAKENQSIVSVELQSSEKTDLLGFIFDYDDECAYIAEIDNYGFDNGKSICNIEDISIMSVDQHRDLRIKILHSLNYDKATK